MEEVGLVRLARLARRARLAENILPRTCKHEPSKIAAPRSRTEMQCVSSATQCQ